MVLGNGIRHGRKAPKVGEVGILGEHEAQGREAIATYKVVFHKKVLIMEKGICTKNLYIPYTSIKECGYYNRTWFRSFTCIIKYVDDQGKNKEVKFRSRADCPFAVLNLYTDILRISKQYGHKIAQKPDEKLINLANQLKDLNVESEFIEADVQQNKASEGVKWSGNFWQRDVGGLKLSCSNVERIKVTESGNLTINPGSTYVPVNQYNYETRYHTDWVIPVEQTLSIDCVGRPKRKFPRGLVDYEWQEGGLAQEPKQDMTLREIMSQSKKPTWSEANKLVEGEADSGRRGHKLTQRLNQDGQLRQMLIKAKAPAIRITGNHIYIEDKNFPSQKLSQCVDTIACYIRQEAGW